jgi:hypothetical protein
MYGSQNSKNVLNEVEHTVDWRCSLWYLDSFYVAFCRFYKTAKNPMHRMSLNMKNIDRRSFSVSPHGISKDYWPICSSEHQMPNKQVLFPAGWVACVVGLATKRVDNAWTNTWPLSACHIIINVYRHLYFFFSHLQMLSLLIFLLTHKGKSNSVILA